MGILSRNKRFKKFLLSLLKPLNRIFSLDIDKTTKNFLT